MRIQMQMNGKDDFPEYGEALLSKVQQYKSLFYAWDHSQIVQDGNPKWPTIAQAAGKIVDRMCSASMSINKINGELWAANWHDNSQILLQDLWGHGPTVEEKCVAIKTLIEKAERYTGHTVVKSY